jgi:hypothetical protein
MRDSKIFDEAVEKYFAPIAGALGLLLLRVQDGIYDIPSACFILRIRLDTGHRSGLNVFLRPAEFHQFDENEPGIEYGLGNLMLFKGEPWEDPLIETDDDFVKRAEWLAKMSERFAVPYLLGQENNWEAIKEMVRQRTIPEIEKIKSYRYPKNVREEWL